MSNSESVTPAAVIAAPPDGAGKDSGGKDLSSENKAPRKSGNSESNEESLAPIPTSDLKPNNGEKKASELGTSFANSSRPTDSSPVVERVIDRRYAGRCSPERLSGETSRQDRRELAAALAHVLRAKLTDGKSIYLDGLGVLFAEAHEVPRAYVLGSRLAIRRESLIKLNFERAGELSPFIRERYHGPLELGDFYQDVYRHLPLAVEIAWTQVQMRFYLSGLISLLRREIVLDGFSHRLSPLCSFFALHNRHGDSTLDWFAGADIFIHSDFEQVRRVEQPKLMERARFDSVVEFGEVALGTKQHTFPINIAQALNDLGVVASRSFYPEMEVVVLERAPGRLAFLTRGAKDIPLLNGSALGAEFVLDCELPSLAAWPFTVLATLIEAVVSAKNSEDGTRINPSGVTCIALPSAAFGINAESSAINGKSSNSWSGALLSHGLAHEQILLTSGEAVQLLWVTPLLEAERALADRRTPEHIATLLARKGVLLSARLNRASVLFRTEVL